MLNKASYRNSWLDWKLPTYSKNNLLDQLITTDELTGINEDKIDAIIETIRSGKLENEDKHKTYSLHHYLLR